MKSPWPTKKLGEICEIRMGETLIEKDLTGEGIPVYSADSLEVPWGFTSNNRLRFYRGSIIIGARGTIGSVKLPTDEIFTATQTTIVLTPKIKEVASPFLYYFLRKINFKSIQRGTGIPMLTVGTLSSFEIPLPPFSIQQKIVKILDTIQSAVELQEKIVEKTKELKKSMMAELFKYGGPSFRRGGKLKKTEIGEVPEDWEVVRLGEVCDLYQPKTISGKEILEEGPYKVYGANGVIGYYTKYNHEDSEVLITCRGSTCGSINVSEPKSWITGNAMVVHPKVKNLNKKFLYYLLYNSDLSKTISGSGQPQITRATLYPYKIPLPSFPEQQEIAEILQTIDQKIEIEKKKKELYEELFKTMLNKIMSQEINVEKIEV